MVWWNPQPQPAWLLPGRVRRHVPDFLLLHANRTVQVVKVKPAARLADPGADPRWLEMARRVLAGHTEASKPTRDLILTEVTARLDG